MKINYMTVLLLAAGLVCSCSRIDIADESEGADVLLRAGLPTVQSKTWLDYRSGGSPLKVYWSDGDKVNVNGQTSLPLSIEEGEKISDADFLLSNLMAPYRVIYPSSVVTDAGYDAEGTITIELPSEQVYNPDSFSNGSAVMYGYHETDEGGVELKNLCAVVRVNVKGSGDNIISARLFSSSEKSPVSGSFKLSPADGSLVPVEGKNEIILDMEKLAMNNESGTDFFFAIPAGDYSKGLSFFFTRESDHKTMQNIWRPDDALVGGKLYSFNGVDFTPTAKEIETEQEWNEFAAAFNSGSDISKYLFKDNAIRLGADISSEDLTSITKTFGYVFDGNGNTIIRTAAKAPLFASVTGEIKNLVLGGELNYEVTEVSEPQTVAFAPLASSLDGGKLSGCTNNMSVTAGTADKLLTAHVYASGLVSVITGGSVVDCTNNATVDVSVDVDNNFLEVALGGIVADIRVPDGESNQTISMTDCRNTGDLTLSPALTFKSAASTADKGMKVCGFGGIAGWLRNEATYTFTNCDNVGQIHLDASLIKHANGNSPRTIAVGGILGLAAPNPDGLMLDPAGAAYYDTYNVSLENCDNSGTVYNRGVNYSSTGESKNKVFTGGIAGALMGISDAYSEVVSCTSTGKVLTHDFTSDTPDVTPSGRAAYCVVAGGLVGYGGFLDIDASTIKCQIGNGMREMVAWGGVIGYTIRPFNLKNCTVDVSGYFQRIDGYKMNRAVVGVVPVEYGTSKAMDLVPNVSGSSIVNNSIKCVLWSSASTVKASTVDLSSTLTLNICSSGDRIKSNLVCGQGFTANEGVTIGDDNSYL